MFNSRKYVSWEPRLKNYLVISLFPSFLLPARQSLGVIRRFAHLFAFLVICRGTLETLRLSHIKWLMNAWRRFDWTLHSVSRLRTAGPRNASGVDPDAGRSYTRGTFAWCSVLLIRAARDSVYVCLDIEKKKTSIWVKIISVSLANSTPSTFSEVVCRKDQFTVVRFPFRILTLSTRRFRQTQDWNTLHVVY